MACVYIPGDAGTFGNYVRAVERCGGAVCCNGDWAGCDLLLLPGGGDVAPGFYGQENTASAQVDPRRDARELALIDRFLAEKKPIIGICRGMQLLNVYFGGDLIQEHPGHSQINGKDRLHEVHTAPSLLRGICGETCCVNSAHHQVVGRLGEGLLPLQWAADGAVEAFCHKQLPVWGLQWHPERLHAPGCVEGLRVYQALLADF